mmetsp:Transcript_145831/g.406180  ORF Transcript_145831/g.406180 Transcript_145831/m.406180 type:complete len:317 (+) Transcript_145831:74-1024(+)
MSLGFLLRLRPQGSMEPIGLQTCPALVNRLFVLAVPNLPIEALAEAFLQFTINLVEDLLARPPRVTDADTAETARERAHPYLDRGVQSLESALKGPVGGDHLHAHRPLLSDLPVLHLNELWYQGYCGCFFPNPKLQLIPFFEERLLSELIQAETVVCHECQSTIQYPGLPLRLEQFVVQSLGTVDLGPGPIAMGPQAPTDGREGGVEFGLRPARCVDLPSQIRLELTATDFAHDGQQLHRRSAFLQSADHAVGLQHQVGREVLGTMRLLFEVGTHLPDQQGSLDWQEDGENPLKDKRGNNGSSCCDLRQLKTKCTR